MAYGTRVDALVVDQQQVEVKSFLLLCQENFNAVLEIPEDGVRPIILSAVSLIDRGQYEHAVPLLSYVMRDKIFALQVIQHLPHENPGTIRIFTDLLGNEIITIKKSALIMLSYYIGNLEKGAAVNITQTSRVIPGLYALLSHANKEIQDHAAIALTFFIPHLIKGGIDVTENSGILARVIPLLVLDNQMMQADAVLSLAYYMKESETRTQEVVRVASAVALPGSIPATYFSHTLARLLASPFNFIQRNTALALAYFMSFERYANEVDKIAAIVTMPDHPTPMNPIRALGVLLCSPEEVTRGNAALALSYFMQFPNGADKVQQIPDVAKNLVAVLASSKQATQGHAAIALACFMMKSRERTEQIAALSIVSPLPHVGTVSVGRALALLLDSDMATVKRNAATALTSFMENSRPRVLQVVESKPEIVTSLSQLLDSREDRTKSAAACTLGSLISQLLPAEALRLVGPDIGIKLVELLGSTDTMLRDYAASTLSYFMLKLPVATATIVAHYSDIAVRLANLLLHAAEGERIQEYAAFALANFVKSNERATAIERATTVANIDGVIPKLAELLSSVNQNTQIKSALALNNLMTYKQVEKVAQAVPMISQRFEGLLKSPHNSVKVNGAVLLATFMQDSVLGAELVATHSPTIVKSLGPLLVLTNDPIGMIKGAAASAFSNFMFNSDPRARKTKEDHPTIVNDLVALLDSLAPITRESAAQALTSFMYNSEERIQDVMQSHGIAQKLMSLLKNQSSSRILKKWVAFVLQQLMSKAGPGRDQIVQTPGLPEELVKLLVSDEENTRGFAVSALGDFMANSPERAEQVYKIPNAAQYLLATLAPNNLVITQKNAVIALINLMDGSETRMDYLMHLPHADLFGRAFADYKAKKS